MYSREYRSRKNIFKNTPLTSCHFSFLSAPPGAILISMRYTALRPTSFNKIVLYGTRYFKNNFTSLTAVAHCNIEPPGKFYAIINK